MLELINTRWKLWQNIETIAIRLTTGSRTITSDRTVYNVIRRFLFLFELVGTISLEIEIIEKY